MKSSIKDFYCKRDQIRSFLRIWSHLLKKSLMENFIFSAMWTQYFPLQTYLFLWKQNYCFISEFLKLKTLSGNVSSG